MGRGTWIWTSPTDRRRQVAPLQILRFLDVNFVFTQLSFRFPCVTKSMHSLDCIWLHHLDDEMRTCGVVECSHNLTLGGKMSQHSTSEKIRLQDDSERAGWNLSPKSGHSKYEWGDRSRTHMWRRTANSPALQPTYFSRALSVVAEAWAEEVCQFADMSYTCTYTATGAVGLQ